MDLTKQHQESLFQKQFFFNATQLEYRFNILKGLNFTDKSNQSYCLMILDSFLVLFRSLFLEKGENNYTFQNFFRMKSIPDVADRIDIYLNQEFPPFSLSRRNALKYLTDKFVCHLDSVASLDIGLANAISAFIVNPYHEYNIVQIMIDLDAIISNGYEQLQNKSKR